MSCTEIWPSHDTPAVVPPADRYNTTYGVEVTGIEARPTVGALFALLFAAQFAVTTTVSPASLAISRCPAA